MVVFPCNACALKRSCALTGDGTLDLVEIDLPGEPKSWSAEVDHGTPVTGGLEKLLRLVG